MTTPKLPPLPTPQIPNSMRKGANQQEPPKSNFFFILMMTLLVVMTFRMFGASEPDQQVPLERPTSELGGTPELTDDERAALSQDFVETAEQMRNKVEPGFVTLGSLDPESPYRMLITLSSRGAALTRVELNEKSYIDNSDSTGYLGQIVVDETLVQRENLLGLSGVAVQAVGKGTPAERAGLKQGDRIVSFVSPKGESVEIRELKDLRNALLQTSPGDKIKLALYSVEQLDKCDGFQTLKDNLATQLAMQNGDKGFLLDLDSGEKAKTDDTDSQAGAGEETSVSSETDDEKVAIEEIDVTSEKEGDEGKSEIPSFDYSKELGEPKVVEVELVHAPLSVLRPSGMVRNYDDYLELVGLQGGYTENNDVFYLLNDDKKIKTHERKMNSEPASFLATLGKVDGDSLSDWAPRSESDRRIANSSMPRSQELDQELSGVDLRNGYWSYSADESSENVAVFKKFLLERQLEVVKKYELVQIAEQKSDKDSDDSQPRVLGNGRAYNLKLTLQIRNHNPSKSRVVSCLLDGPTGLPLEGAWFSAGRKTGPKWGAYGLRDLVVSLNDQKTFNVVKCMDIAQDKFQKSDEVSLDFLGVDGQYFQCTAIPTAQAEEKFAFSPIRVGSRDIEHLNFADVSFRLKCAEKKLAPHGEKGDSYSQEFTVFVGPKQRDVMADYGLSKTIVYGWFWFVSIPLLWVLHFFHDYVVFNYGLAIMMLTILVRLCLFPLSRKQVVSSIRMQKLQPELTALKEKYKDKPQEMMVAQQALFKKHGVNPLSGCLPIFIQMPIFIGLYKALSLDVNLYGAPLFSKGVRWCSNLAAPDMAFDWSSFWNQIGWSSFNLNGRGFSSMFCLGPYLNILPVITIALFLIQQKVLVPPVVGDDEQARQQRSMRRMMNFMMIFMGFMFFKVPSGLCVYFIVSSLWGLLERKMLPKKDLELNTASSTAGNDFVSQTASVAGFESRKDKRRSFASTGRKYEIYERKRDSKGRRIASSNNNAPQKSSLRAWWDEVVERAKEQQRLAKSEEEDRQHNLFKRR